MTEKTKVQTDPKEKIISLIEKSDDSGLGKRKSFWLGAVDFSDVIDIVLYYISLQPDLDKIARIESHDFYEALRKVWDIWGEGVKKSWGYRKYDHPCQGYEHKRFPKFYDLDSAWQSGPGPMGGTMGAAEHYAYIHPGFLKHKYLILFFSYPEGLPFGAGNWPAYREHNIKKMVFPKWRRKANKKKLEMVFQLAEMLCNHIKELPHS